MIAVTGGAGFIGANLCRALSAADLGPIRAIDNLSTGDQRNLADLRDVELIPISILDSDRLTHALMGARSVVHLAALPSVPRSLRDPVATHDANATGTIRVLEVARVCDIPHVIVASSSSVYGGNPVLPKSENLSTLPMSPYAASKLAAENYALAYGASFGLSVLAFRLFNVFGPLQPANHAYAAVIPKFVDAALNGRRVTVYGDGLQTRDFTFVDSVTDVIIRAVREQVSHPGPVNLAFGTRTSLLEVIAHLEGILARPLEVDFQPSRRSDVRDSQADDSRLRSLLPGVEPLPFEIGLRRTIEWFRGRHPDAPLGDHS